MEELMLSIYITTYNHEKYIAQALDSILMQKTGYLYEVLIGDDVSQDGTRKVLREYEDKYPNRFKIFYRDHNMNDEVPNNGEDLRRRCKGKYVIALEGDDYWTDPNKIEFQISFLEKHPEYIAVAHNCLTVDGESKPTGEPYQECKQEIYTFRHFTAGILPGQFTTVMYRNYMLNPEIDYSLLATCMLPTDRYLYFMLANYGRIYCEQKIRSAYRHIVKGGTSYSATWVYNFEKDEKWSRRLLKYAYCVGNSDAVCSAETLYIRTIKSGIKRGQCGYLKAVKYMVKEIKFLPATVIKMLCEKRKRRGGVYSPD